ARAAIGHELVAWLHWVDRKQSELGWHHRYLDQHQPDRSEVSVPHAGPDVGAGAQSILWRGGSRFTGEPRHHRSRSAVAAVPAVPEREYEPEHRGALAVSRGDLPAAETGDWHLGRRFQLHVQSAERQSVRSEQLLFKLARVAEQLRGGSGVAVLQP